MHLLVTLNLHTLKLNFKASTCIFSNTITAAVSLTMLTLFIDGLLLDSACEADKAMRYDTRIRIKLRSCNSIVRLLYG